MLTYFVYLLSVKFTNTAYTNIQLDTLSPYPTGGHTSRTQRNVRDCRKVIHGDLAHVSIKTKQPSNTYDLHNIKYRHKKGTAFGHWTVINDPFHMISVLEPLKPGGCAMKKTAYVADSARQKNCRVAINAGFFEPDPGPNYGACLGNIISDARQVNSNNGTQNVVFGIRRDGTVVIGYLSEDEIEDQANGFVQLINGVGWVLRDGKTYLTESAEAECKDLQTTGSLETFFNVLSARTLLGVDNLGRVHLVQFDGKTHESGVNLYEAADYLKTLNITNAINFDGGGSATYVVDSTMVNYPTNDWKKSILYGPVLNVLTSTLDGRSTDEHGYQVLCPKNVSTIICVHDGTGQESMTVTMKRLVDDSNRNYGVVILLTVIIGTLMLSNVFLCNLYILYRNRVNTLSSTSQKREALRNLLQERNSSEPESDEDEL